MTGDPVMTSRQAETRRQKAITAGTSDFQGIAAHEISKVLGRLGLSGETIGTTANSSSLIVSVVGLQLLDVIGYDLAMPSAAAAAASVRRESSVLDKAKRLSGPAGTWKHAALCDLYE